MEPTLADRNYNPGNLKDPKTGQFRQFSNEGEGYAALMNDLQGKVEGTTSTGLNGDSTLHDFSSTWAPASDKNDPAQYTANLANKLGVRPDTKLSELKSRIPDLAQAIAANEGYTKAKGFKTGQVSTSIPKAQPQEKTFAQDLGADLSKVGTGLKETTQNLLSGKMKAPLISAPLQAVGSVAGAIGDVVSTTLEHTPIVGKAISGIENLIGQGVGALAKTEAGKAVAKSIGEFTKKHPELAADIGAGFNIITAIPILKGLSAIKNVTMDAVSQGLKSVAEKGAAKDLTEVLSRTMGGKKALAKSPDSVKTIVKERLLPEIENGKYATKNVVENLDDLIESKDNILDKILKAETKSGVKPLVDLKEMRANALASAEGSLEGQGNYKSVINKINELFDTAENSSKAVSLAGTKYIDLSDANFFKRQARKGLTWDDTVGRDAGFHVGQSYMKGIEDMATKNGLGNVHAANKEIGDLIKAGDLLGKIDNKPVKLTGIGKAFKTAGTETGAFGGGLLAKGLGLPEVATTFLGGSGGRYLGGKTGGLIRSARESILSRTGTNAVNTTAKEATKKIGGLVGTSVITHPKKK